MYRRVGSQGVRGGGRSNGVRLIPARVVLFFRRFLPPFFFSPMVVVAVGVTAVEAAPVITPVPRSYIAEGYSSVTIPEIVAQFPPVEQIDVGGSGSKVGAT